MIDRIIDQFTRNMSITQTFCEDTLTLTIVTRFGRKIVHEHTTDMTPMFNAFKKRMKK